MKDIFKADLFSCIRDFSQLNGWRKVKVIFGTSPDARFGRLQDPDRSVHYWPSKTSKKHNHGYIAFESGKRFDLQTETINGENLYIFRRTLIIENLWRIQISRANIMDWWQNASVPDRKTLSEIIMELDKKVRVVERSCPLTDQEIVAELIAMGLNDLEALASLLEPNGLLVLAVAA